MNDLPGVSIGKAAALYGLAPSTVRWWEAQGVLPKPPRVNGRRVYTETELRRIGLAYLCCVTSGIPLEQAAVVTTGTKNQQWQCVVKRHVELIEQRLRELQGAHEHLLHLLHCPDDDIVDECPWLDNELMNRTPRGRVAAESFVAAAQSLPRHAAAVERDETDSDRDETSVVPLSRCPICASRFPQRATGRRRRFCSRACQQRHYRQTAR